jgi:4-amino-4-deoxy-L-arabinose transferase-like glycosyltransferase
MNDSKTQSVFIWSDRETKLLLVVLLLAICCFFPALGSFGILDPSDGYYSEGAREMVESGDYLTPHLNYEPFFDKPIFNYWLIAACFRLFGVTELASRLPAASLAVLICVGIFVFARQFLSRRAAFIASLALMSSPMWMSLGHMSLTDMPLSCFVWISLFSFLLAIERNIRPLVWLGYLAMACGLMTKGPLAGFLIVANLALYLLVMKRQPREWLRLIGYLHVFSGLAVTLILAAPWYFSENAATSGKFFQEFFLNQNINRAMGTVDHKAGPLYYFPLFVGGAFPWSIYLLALIPIFAREPFRRIKRIWQRSSAAVAVDTNLNYRVKLTVFAVLSSVFMLTFFTVLPTKLATYLLPVFPALALLSGVLFDKMMRFKKIALLPLPASLVALVCGVAAIALLLSTIGHSLNLGHSKQAAAIAAAIAHSDTSLRLIVGLSLTVMTAGALSLLVSTWSNSRKGLRVQIQAIVLAMAVAVPSALILAWQDKCRDFQQLVRESGDIKANAIMLGRRSPSAEFYLHQKVRFVAGEETIADDAKASPTGTYFLLNEYIVSLLSDAGVDFEKVAQRGDWQLIKTK